MTVETKELIISE